MRVTRAVAALAAACLAAAGCTPFGGTGGMVSAGQQSTLGPGRSWLVSTAGSPVPSPLPSLAATTGAPALPTPSAAPSIGATKPSGPPFTVTFGLPIADDPWLPG